MSNFKTSDLLKRNNCKIILDIASNNETLTLGKKSDGEQFQIFAIRCGSNENPSHEDVFQHCLSVRGKPPELQTAKGWIPLTRFYKDKRFRPLPRKKSLPDVRDKVFQQRQEKSLVDVMNQWGHSVKIDNIKTKITFAYTAPDIGPHGKENLVDVILEDEVGTKFNVSCKMSRPADLGSGGICGLKNTVPDLVERVYYKIKIDLHDLGFYDGKEYHISSVPSLFYPIPVEYAYRIFRGSTSLGGEIDYFYQGPENVEFDGEKINGEFIPTSVYAAKKKYYLRLRKRNIFNNIVKINFTKMNSYGLPFIFSSGVGDFASARFVINDNIPTNGLVRKLWL